MHYTEKLNKHLTQGRVLQGWMTTGDILSKMIFHSFSTGKVKIYPVWVKYAVELVILVEFSFPVIFL